jgi:hypothetical protein
MDFQRLQEKYHVDFTVKNLEFYRQLTIYFLTLHKISLLEKKDYSERIYTIFKRVADLIMKEEFERDDLSKGTAQYFLHQVYERRKWITDEAAQRFQQMMDELPDNPEMTRLKEAEINYLAEIRKETGGSKI